MRRTYEQSVALCGRKRRTFVRVFVEIEGVANLFRLCLSRSCISL